MHLKTLQDKTLHDISRISLNSLFCDAKIFPELASQFNKICLDKYLKDLSKFIILKCKDLQRIGWQLSFERRLSDTATARLHNHNQRHAGLHSRKNLTQQTYYIIVIHQIGQQLSFEITTARLHNHNQRHNSFHTRLHRRKIKHNKLENY